MTVLELIKAGKINEFKYTPGNLNFLRKFHNWIKLELILSAAEQNKTKNLLDIGVGRGGDLIKWSKAGIIKVTGIDSDHDSIYATCNKNGFDGAVIRYSQTKKRTEVPKCFFWNMSATDPNTLENLNNKDFSAKYDLISSQFAFHYFVKDIDTTLELVKSKLKVGGLFIGTAADGDLIKANLESGDISFPFLRITKIDNEMYSFNLNVEQTGGTESYFQIKGESIEYFLCKDYLIKKAAEHSLKLVRIQNFSEYYSNSKCEVFLSKEEKLCSFLNFSFVFMRID
jgi:mRNA (guanine-N7-)-methyltransferase